MTLNGKMSVILRYSAEFGSFVVDIMSNWLKMDLLSARKMWSNNLVFSNI